MARSSIPCKCRTEPPSSSVSSCLINVTVTSLVGVLSLLLLLLFVTGSVTTVVTVTANDNNNNNNNNNDNNNNNNNNALRNNTNTNHHHLRQLPTFRSLYESNERKDFQSMDDPTKHEMLQNQHSSVAPFLGPLVEFPSVPTTTSTSTSTSNATFQQELPLRTTRIVGGEKVKPEENGTFQYFAMLLVREEAEGGEWRWSGCGGTLVSDCHIITAAHCVTNSFLSVRGIYVNAYSPFLGNNSRLPYHFSMVNRSNTNDSNNNNGNGHGNGYGVQVHPSYVKATNRADIAIITMQKCLDVTMFPPARIPMDDDIYQQTEQDNDDDDDNPLMVQVMGFGSTTGNVDESSNVLRKANLPFLSRKQCYSYYPGEILDDMVCAGYIEGNKADACQGDSGGGLFHFDHDDDDDNDQQLSTTTMPQQQQQQQQQQQPNLIGIVSWGVGCALENKPGVYIYVPFYRDWIMEQICPDVQVPAGVPRNSAKQYTEQQRRQRPWCQFPTDAPTLSPTRTHTWVPTSGPTRAPTMLPEVTDDPAQTESDLVYPTEMYSANNDFVYPTRTIDGDGNNNNDAMIVKTSAPTFAPPPRQQQQQQKQQQREGDGSCQTEGQTCSDDDDCCSNYCRGFSHVEYTLCAGPLPTRLPMPTTFQAETQQRHSFQKQDAATGTRRNEYP